MLKYIVSKIYGSGIGNLPIIKQIYYIHEYIIKKIYKNDIIKKVKYKNTEFSININLKDGFVQKEIFMRNIYEEEIMKVIYDILKKGDYFADVGANIGYYSLFGSKLVGDSGKVIGFEPVKNIYEKFVNNIKLNNLNNIIPLNYGLGDKEENIVININEKNTGHSSIVNNEGKNIKEQIKIVNFDKIVENYDLEKIKLIKIDVEGYEYEAIKGMKKFLDNKKSNIFIIIEFTPKFYDLISTNYKNEFVEYIKNNKYDIHLIEKTLQKIDIEYLTIVNKQINVLISK